MSISTAVVVLTFSYITGKSLIAKHDAAKQETSFYIPGTISRQMDQKIHAAFQHSALKMDTGIIEGHMLMRMSDCYTCHADNKVVTAPSYTEIAEKYKNDKSAPARLVNKIIEGGKGQWGDKPMNPHPELLREDAQKMIAYILHLRTKKDTAELPVKSQ